MKDTEFYSAWLSCAWKLIIGPILTIPGMLVKVVLEVFRLPFDNIRTRKEQEHVGETE